MREIKEIEQELKEAIEASNRKKKLDEIERKKSLLPLFEQRYTKSNLKKLLRERIEFSYYENGGDYVYIGSDGKRPFGNSNVERDVSETLGFGEEFRFEEFEFEYISKKLSELLNEIIRDIK